MDDIGLGDETTMLNLANVIVSELQAASPYKTGKMRASITLAMLDGNFIDIVVATDYASYVNAKGKHQGWIERVLERSISAFIGSLPDDSSLRTGIAYSVLTGI